LQTTLVMKANGRMGKNHQLNYLSFAFPFNVKRSFILLLPKGCWKSVNGFGSSIKLVWLTLGLVDKI
jgi:hypothetical protein